MAVQRPTSGCQRKVTVRRRPVSDGGLAGTEAVSTTPDTTVDGTPTTVNTTPTTADTTPTTVRSSVTNEEGMRDALEPSDRTGERTEDLERAERLLEDVGRSLDAGSVAGEDSRFRTVLHPRHTLETDMRH